MKTLHCILLLLISISIYPQTTGHQNLVNTIAPVRSGSLYAPRFISYTGNHHIATFYPRKKRGNVAAGVDLVVSDIYGNIILSRGVAMDSAIKILGGGGTNDGGYYIIAQHKDPSYTKFQLMLIRLDTLGAVLWSSAAEYLGNNINETSTVLEDETGNFYVGQDGYHLGAITSFDPNGGYRWSTCFAYDTVSGSAYSMCLTGDTGIICIGESKYDKVLTVVNYNGSVRWSKIYKTDSSYVNYRFIHKTRDGGYITGGAYQYLNQHHVGCGICKFDHYGNAQWETYLYKNSGCASPSMVDAAENWDGRISAISFDNGMQNMIFNTNGDYMAYLKKYPTHQYGSLHSINNHIVAVTYSGILTNPIGSADTVECSFFESDHVLNICGGYNDVGISSASITDSNLRFVNNGHRVYPGRARPFAMWSVTNINVSYTGFGVIECTPPLIHNDTISTPIDTNTTPIDTTGSTGVTGIDPSDLLVYPNPTTGKVEITLPNPLDVNVRLLDMEGKLLFFKSYSGQNIKVDLSSYSDGIYMLNVSDRENKTLLVRKLVIMQ